MKKYVAVRRILVYGLASVFMAVLASACASTRTTESTGGYIDDAAITAKVKAQLAADPEMRNPIQTPLQVRVETYKGTVQLSGFVNTPEASERAEMDASQIPGVSHVVNNLIVKQQLSRAPAPPVSRPVTPQPVE